MSDGQTLLLIFVLIYLSDSFAWVSLSGYAAVSRWGRDWRLRLPSPRFDGLGGGMVALQPFPPLGTVFVTEPWPFSLTAEAISPVTREVLNPGSPPPLPKGARSWCWSEIERVSTDRKRLLINGQPFAHVSSEFRARCLVNLLRRLKALPESERAAAIDRELASSLRGRHAARLVRVLLRGLRPLRFTCCVLFVVVFLVLPPVYWWYGDDRPTWATLLVMWLLMLQCTVEYICLHRRLYPTLSGERWQHAVLGLFLPHYAIRTLDSLTKEFLVACHPLAVAAALGDQAEFHRFAATRWRDLRHPVPLGDGDEARIAQESQERHLAPAVEKMIRSLVPEAEIASWSHPPEEESPRHCPRCHLPYEVEATVCRDCGGVPLVSKQHAPESEPVPASASRA